MAMVTFEATDEEKKLIEKHAKKGGMSVSDYVRSCVFLDLMVSGDIQALRLLGRRIRDKQARVFERLRQGALRQLLSK